MISFYRENYTKEQIEIFIELLTDAEVKMLDMADCLNSTCKLCNYKPICRDMESFIKYLNKLVGE